MREIDVVFDPERKLFLYFGVLFLAIGVGPFGTYADMSFWQRVVFWSLDIAGGMVIIVPIMHVFYASAPAQGLPSPLRLFVGTALGALPGAGYISVLYGLAGGNPDALAPFPLLFAQVTLFSFMLFLVEFLLWPVLVRNRAAPAPVTEQETLAPPPVSDHAASPKALDLPAPPPGQALLRRLPAELREARLVSISMQDHYAQIVTTRGETLLLIRLRDALELIGDTAGLQIHRSHWVAADQMRSLVRDGRRYEVTLRDGRQLPVGGTFLDQVRQRLPETS